MIYEITDTAKAAALFGDWEETMIWSCLQGIMGKIYADDPAHPSSAMAVLGDFTFFTGEVNGELIAYKPDGCTNDYMIMTPPNDLWQNAITAHYDARATIRERYAIRKEPDVFDQEKLARIVSALPAPYRICMIDEALYEMCKAQSWSADLVSLFRDYGEYARLGLGAVILKDQEIVSGASSYTRYRDGIEIEIDTRADFRRQGLALACGAKLILECLDRGLYPSWDAQNKESVALAQKLGYHYSHTYTVVDISDY